MLKEDKRGAARTLELWIFVSSTQTVRNRYELGPFFDERGTSYWHLRRF
jgi:hypothetical protein